MIAGDIKKERPILFSAPMVRAILDGSKTQTRRIMKPQPTPSESCENDFWFPVHAVRSMVHVKKDQLPGCEGLMKSVSPYDCERLWVRETWRTNSIYDDDKPSLIPDSAPIEYLANTISGDMAGKIRPSIFMPRWASRINLEIVDVRVERLQDISDEDAKAEGIAPTPGRDIVDRWLVKNPKGSLSEYSSTQYPVDAYKSLWQSINGSASWDSNPWVWVIEFRNDL